MWDNLGTIPGNYITDNLYNSIRHPSEIHAQDAGLTRYFERYLLQKCISVFEFDLPDEWSYTYFLYGLFFGGYAIILNTDLFGTIVQTFPNATLYGRNLYYQPTNALITNPLIIGNTQPQIGKDCELIKLQPDYGGVMDIISYYAELMSVASNTAAVNILNSKLSYIIGVDNRGSAETFKKVLDEIASGKPGVVTGKKLFTEDGRPLWDTFAQNLNQNFIAPELFECIRQLDADFCTEIGLENVNIAKSSGVSEAEVIANNTATKSKASLWLETMTKDIEKVNRMFNLNLSVKFRWEGDNNGPEI